MLSYLIKGIIWLSNDDVSITNSDGKFCIDSIEFYFISVCNLQDYAVIHNDQQQEYEIHNTYLFNDDLQLIKKSFVRSILKG
jgi:hypothetical protein